MSRGRSVEINAPVDPAVQLISSGFSAVTDQLTSIANSVSQTLHNVEERGLHFLHVSFLYWAGEGGGEAGTQLFSGGYVPPGFPNLGSNCERINCRESALGLVSGLSSKTGARELIIY